MNVAQRRQLIAEYGRLQRLDGHTPQSRGRRFNEAIAQLLRSWGIEATTSVRTTGEIDVAFALDGVRFVLEAKWEQGKADTGHIAKLQKRVRQRLAGTYGIFLSMSGYSSNALADVSDGERLEILLLDAGHWEAMLSGLMPPNELLGLIHDRAAFHGEPYTPLLDLMATVSREQPKVSFDPPSTMTSGVLASAAKGVAAKVVLSEIESNQLGIACASNDRLLVTTADGILRVNLGHRSVELALPISHCHRNSLMLSDGSIVFTRRHGVGRFLAGQLTVIGGGLAGNSCLLVNPDGSIWAFDNGTPAGMTASVTKLEERLGDQTWHEIDYPPASAFTSAWLSNSDLLTIGNSGFVVTSLRTGRQKRYRAPQSNPMGLVHLGHGVILTAGDAVTVGQTDTTTGHYRELAQLAVRPSVTEMALAPDGTLYLAAYHQTADDKMSIAVIHLRLPKEPHGSELVLHGPESGDLPAIVAPAEPPASAESRNEPPNSPSPVNTATISTETIGQPTTAPSDSLTNVVSLFVDAREHERGRGYQDALRFAPSLRWDDLQSIARHNFDIPRWLTGWKNGWLDIEMNQAPPGALVAPWLPILADYLGSMVDPIGFDRWSFTHSDEYVAGFAAALQDVWNKASQHRLRNDHQQD